MNWVNPTLLLVSAIGAVFLQSKFDLFRTVFGTQFDLLPVLMVYNALTNGVASIAVLAVVGGLGIDSLSANPLGVSVLPLFLIGFVIFHSRSLLLRENTYAQFVFGLSASAAAPVLTVLILQVNNVQPMLGWGSLWQWLVLSFSGALLTPVCFRAFDRIGLSLNYQPLPESSFRQDRQIKRGR